VKRLITIGVFVIAAAAILAMPTGAKDTKGPACANFTFGIAGYSAVSGNGDAHMTLDAAGCTGTYLLQVYPFTSGGTGTRLASDIEPSGYSVDDSTGNTVVDFSYTLSSPPSDGVCLVAESYWRGHLADRAPDSGCQKVDPTSGGGDSGFS
jgi:hypothetical protein